MILIVKHIFIEGPGVIGDFFQNSKRQVQTVELMGGDKLPNDLKDIEAIIVLGGPMNVYQEEKYPFLKDEDGFLKEAVELEIPTLGICLGAQALAKAAGAKVKKAEREEIGWYKVNLTNEGQNDRLFKNLGKNLDVFQWHEDQFDLPQNTVLLAESDSCRNQAFKLGKCAYAMQFHIEVTPVMVESWIKQYWGSADRVRIAHSQKMLIEAYRKKGRFLRQANKILLNFSQLI